jgi:hypothetical protein
MWKAILYWGSLWYRLEFFFTALSKQAKDIRQYTYIIPDSKRNVLVQFYKILMMAYHIWN